MSGRSADELLEEAAEHLAVASSYARLDISQQVVLDGAALRLAAGIEALSRLEPQHREHLFGSRWPIIWGMRNRIAHGYMFVDAGILTRTLRDDLPLLLETIDEERARLSSD